MKKLLVIIIFTFLSKPAVSQTDISPSSYSSYRPGTLNSDSGVVHKESASRLSFGVGTAMALGTDKFSYFVSINGIFQLNKVLFIETEIDVFPEPKHKSPTFMNFDCELLAGFEMFKKKLTIFVGGGGFVYIPLDSPSPVGLVASFRAEYTLSKKSSLGIEFKHPNYIGAFAKDNPILLISLTHTFRL